MEWWLVFIIIFGSLIVLFAAGMPVAFAFMLINIVGVYLFWGGVSGFHILILSIFSSVTTFVLLPFPLFVLMGEVMFRTGIASNAIDAIDKWLGRLPGRLSFLAVAGGVLMSTLSGSTMASCAVLGRSLVPEMEKRGYKKPMSLGPILGSGGLAMMIPPSGMAVLTAALARISVGGLLMAGIIPGLLMGSLYAAYIYLRCKFNPYLAPPYVVPPIPVSAKLKAVAQHILPLSIIIFLVIGVIFLGIASPSEAAATGALGTFIFAAAYRKLNWQVAKESILSGTKVAGMMLIIMTGSKAFSQILSFSGVSTALVEIAAALPVHPIIIIIAMMMVLMFLGCFMDSISMLMITLPIYMPVIRVLGFDPLWFGLLLLINAEISTTSPPFGINLFVMKGVSPPDTTMMDLYRGAIPFILCDLVALGLCMAFPILALWVPSMMR